MRKIPERVAAIVSAWAAHAPTEVFGGYSLAQFVEVTNNSLVRREVLDTARIQRAGIIADRMLADSVSLEKMNQVVNSVAGHPDYGTGSPLWVAMGYEQTTNDEILFRAGIEVGEGYTPEDLGPRLWLDAARPGAIQPTHIMDRSFFGNHMLRFGPQEAAQIGGLPAIGLPPQAYLRNDTLFLDPDFTVAVVSRHYTNAGIRHYFDSGHTGIPVRVTVRHSTDDNVFQVVTRGINEGDGDLEIIRAYLGSYNLGTEPNIFVMGSSGTQSYIRVNGGGKIQAGALGAEGFRGLYVGRRWLSQETHWMNGSIGELIIIPRALTEAELHRLEGYLFWKWLFVERIPIGHPYANQKPQKTS